MMTRMLRPNNRMCLKTRMCLVLVTGSTIARIWPTAKVSLKKLPWRTMSMREMAVMITLCLLLRAPWLRLTWMIWVRLKFLLLRASANTLQTHPTLPRMLRIPVGECRSTTTLELVLRNQNEAHPPMFGILTSPPTEGMSHSEQAIVCTPSSAKLVDRTAGDLGLELLHFLDTLDNTMSPVEEKLETAETKKALETVKQFLGCDMRTVTEASFLAIKEVVEVLISTNHLSQDDAYEVHARLAVVNFSLPPCLEAQKEFETGEKLMSEYEDIRQSIDLGQLHKLKASLDKGRQKVLDLKKQLAEAEEQVKVTSAAI